MINDYLNVKNSTRNLSDDEFDKILPQLADELVLVDFIPSHDDTVLLRDWENLKKRVFDKDTSSTVRVGMKLCEHFFPNFYDIESKGKTFDELWQNPTNLMKILRWNRKGHSTPYLSELKRGIYFCCGLTKSTMFRPHLSKTIVSSFSGDVVLDPCAGWGGRLLGTVASGKQYIGFEPNIDTYNNLLRLVEFLGINNQVTLFNDVAENMMNYEFGGVDIILTSPPYFNLEVYCESDQQCENRFDNYTNWSEQWLNDVIKKSLSKLNSGGVSCWNVHNIGKMKMIDDVSQYHTDCEYDQCDVFSLSSSKRQSNGIGLKNKDITVAFTKH